MEEVKIEIKTEGVQTITRNGHLYAVQWKDMTCRHDVWFKVEEMSMDEMGEMLKDLSKPNA